MQDNGFQLDLQPDGFPYVFSPTAGAVHCWLMLVATSYERRRKIGGVNDGGVEEHRGVWLVLLVDHRGRKFTVQTQNSVFWSEWSKIRVVSVDESGNGI